MDSRQQFNARRVHIYAPYGFPSWCGLDGLDASEVDFADAIVELQRELDIDDDGKCGTGTIEAICAEDYKRRIGFIDDTMGLLCFGPHAVVVSNRVKSFQEHPDLATTRTSVRTKPLTLGIVHYDVTNDTSITHKVLKRRKNGLSIHLGVNWDGVIWQFHNPLTRQCIHAGKRTNPVSLGLDLNSPALRKYERLREGQQPRPTKKQAIHGHTVGFLDYWPHQIDALVKIMELSETYLGLPQQCPRDDEGRPIYGCLWENPYTYDRKLCYNPRDFNGWAGHYHLTRTKDKHTGERLKGIKIDPAPLDWDEVCPIGNT